MWVNLHIFFLFFTIIIIILAKRKSRVVTDIIAILTQILYKLPENCEILSQIVQNPIEGSDESVSYIDFLRHSNPLLRQRICCFLRLLGKNAPNTLETIWSLRMRETLEALVYDSIETVRNVIFVCANDLIMIIKKYFFQAADVAVEELRVLEFY